MVKSQIFATFVVFFFAHSSQAQELQFLKLKKYRITRLADALNETSGLTEIDGDLISFNDSGNAPDLYIINPETGEAIRRTTNAKNYDWEAVTNDGKNLYIGDIGNNMGNRTNLGVYRIPYTEEGALNYDQYYTFQYARQKELQPLNRKNNYDAESMVYHRGHLQIFSKEWQSYDTKHYELRLDDEKKQSLEPLETYHLGYLATDATYYNGQLYIIGYTKKAEVYLSVFTETQPNRFFEAPPKKYYLGMSFKLGQIEGITATPKGLYISGERFKTKISDAKQPLYFLPYHKLK
ncbi:hypothetical protein [Riemerella columbina]|uniref:hypothetical protein n=1 Tax=Riemerella columbina TaxID=103810 RepID=UPI002670051E|nr:hypothetical protein [Riemerella columbina]WKS94353.1 hypothetical protein NYR17_05225 [Riemerella columbina]